MKKYLSLMLVGLFGFVGFASADTITVVSDPDTSIYSPSTISVSSDYTFSVNDIISYVFQEGSDSCDINLSPINSNDYACEFYITSEGVNDNSESSCSFSAGDTIYINRADGYACSSIVIIDPNNPNSSSDSSNSDLGLGINAGLNSAISSGVSSFTAGLGQRVPTLILIGLPILVVLVFWRKIYRFVRRVFRRH